jgi:hypothetical protein
MPVQLSEKNGGTILAVHVSGKLAKSDYEEPGRQEVLAVEDLEKAERENRKDVPDGLRK